MSSECNTSSEHPENVCSVPLAWSEDFLTIEDQMLKMSEFLVRTECEEAQFCKKKGIELYLKKDFRQVTGSCHARSALCTLLTLSAEQKKYGVITALKEEAYPMCYFGEKLNIPIIVVLSKTTPFYCIQACKQFEYFNTKVFIRGDSPEEAEKIAMELAITNNMCYRNDRARFIGYGSIAIEIFKQVPNLDVVVVPFDENDKTLAQSMLLVMNMLKPSVQVVLAIYTSAPKPIQSDLSLTSSLKESNLSDSENGSLFACEIQSSTSSSSFASVETPPTSPTSKIHTSLQQIPTTISFQTSVSPTKSISSVSVQTVSSTEPFASSSSLQSQKCLAPIQEEEYINFNCIRLPITDELMHTAFMKLLKKEQCIVDESSAMSLAACFSDQQQTFKNKRVVSLLTSSNVNILTISKYLEEELNQARLMSISVTIPNIPKCVTLLYKYLLSNICIQKIACKNDEVIKESKKKKVEITIHCGTIMNQNQYDSFVSLIGIRYPNVEVLRQK